MPHSPIRCCHWSANSNRQGPAHAEDSESSASLSVSDSNFGGRCWTSIGAAIGVNFCEVVGGQRPCEAAKHNFTRWPYWQLVLNRLFVYTEDVREGYAGMMRLETASGSMSLA